MPAISFPEFPDDVPTVPLLVIDFALIKAGDKPEVDRLWKAATELGFWYLKNHGAEGLTDAMFDMGAETMELPLDEKMKFEQGDGGRSFGYKYAGANAIDETGTKDAVEFINVSKDDALAWPESAHRTYPSTVNARMESTITPFVEKSLEVNNTLLRVLSERLGLPDGAIGARHLREKYSGSETRVIKSPPQPEISPDKATLGAHTDFGSFSFLHNRLGGLQVLPPGSDGWKYVKPIPGHAICNIGDAMAIFSGGILRSNLHRVVAPPKAQKAFTRWSLVFFTRPNDDTLLEPLASESAMIKEAVDKVPGKYDAGVTSKEWFARRIKNQRVANRTVRTHFLLLGLSHLIASNIALKGPETWRASRGTEHQVDAY
ncbi:hypothetical protein EVG20_g849 [Dentipellis fragilis]|uniref:Fe2OG dioxygenase domain-containing protein n=1 Tax=Dentipellis fragilis TaxID=205917 RepID=A0A4Y9ZE96_9AGAM|nr:hypothetical protein EVG20_g849 [Dentipellis fragilis]